MKFRILKKTDVTMQDFEEDTVTIFKNSEKSKGKPLQFSRNGYTRTVKGILFGRWVFFYHRLAKDGDYYIIPLRK